jgi:thymidine kinase
MNKEQGYLELYIGPMFSGKTTRLVQIYKSTNHIEKKIVAINYYADIRYHQTMLSTHDQQTIPCFFTKTLSEIWTNPQCNGWKELQDADVVLINEGQFFEDIFEIVLNMVEIRRKNVFICGLDGDYKRQKFGKLLDLIPYCDKIEKLCAMCSICCDGTPGLFSHRLTSETSQISIGSDSYMALCRSCYIENGYATELKKDNPNPCAPTLVAPPPPPPPQTIPLRKMNFFK